MKCGDKEWQHCQVEKMGCPGCYYDEIKIGEYVRTRNNGIKRIDTIFENKTVNKYGYECGSDWNGKWYSHIKTTDIVKHSKNLIDLIEIGDILKIKEDDSICYIGLEKDETTLTYQEIIDEIKNNKIKLLAIVTKEQFRSIEYKIEE